MSPFANLILLKWSPGKNITDTGSVWCVTVVLIVRNTNEIISEMSFYRTGSEFPITLFIPGGIHHCCFNCPEYKWNHFRNIIL